MSWRLKDSPFFVTVRPNAFVLVVMKKARLIVRIVAGNFKGQANPKTRCLYGLMGACGNHVLSIDVEVIILLERRPQKVFVAIPAIARAGLSELQCFEAA